jgi:rsbT co-antagonist protein RsbR
MTSESARIAELEQKVRELEDELAHEAQLVDLVFTENPDGVVVAAADGTLTMNAAATAILSTNPIDCTPDEWTVQYGIYRVDRVTPWPNEELPLYRSMTQGAVVDEEVMWIQSVAKPRGVYISVNTRPLPKGGAIAILRDVTERQRLADDLARRNAELADREDENRVLIERLRVAVDELSTPVLELWDDILALPIVGIVDTQRSNELTERLLAEVARNCWKHVIVDLTGVEYVDTSTADRFIKLARAVQLLGARCVVTGIKPGVAQTLVELGVDFGVLETHRNLKGGLQSCLRHDAAAGRRLARA